MSTRAAVNISGSTGEVLEVASLGNRDITCVHPVVGTYVVSGTLGMVPAPEGWGYVVNAVDSTASVSLGFADGELQVRVEKEGAAADLLHSITLHVVVADLVAAIA